MEANNITAEMNLKAGTRIADGMMSSATGEEADQLIMILPMAMKEIRSICAARKIIIQDAGGMMIMNQNEEEETDNLLNS